MSVLQVALLSAKMRAPSLVPVVILMASDEAAHIKATRRRLMDAGAVAVLPHKISFHDNIIKAAGPSRSWVQGAVGSYLRLDVPTFMPQVRLVLTGLDVQLDYVLWTDPGECLLWAPIPNNAQQCETSMRLQVKYTPAHRLVIRSDCLLFALHSCMLPLAWICTAATV